MVIWGIPSALIVAGLTLAKPTLKPGSLSRGIGFMGDVSFSLYLVHPLAITLPRRLLGMYLDPASFPILYATLLLSIALIAACAVHVMFERPLTRYLQSAIGSRYQPKAQPGAGLAIARRPTRP
jgi:peptidoglycan/LPS O-acetylase OafA/YrhL